MGSAAAAAGLAAGDIIIEVNGSSVFSRVDAYHKLRVAPRPQVTWIRNGELQSAIMVKKADEPSGAVFQFDLDPDKWRSFVQLVNRERADNVLVLTSVMAAPLIRETAKKLPDTCIGVEAVPNRSFGGSIACAGLLTVADISSYLGDLSAYDMVVIPEIMFDRKGRDLRGESLPQNAKLTIV